MCRIGHYMAECPTKLACKLKKADPVSYEIAREKQVIEETNKQG